MELSPRLYNWIVRPKWITKTFIHKNIQNNFQFHNKMVLDFGSGTGSNCCLFSSDYYLGIDIDANRVSYSKRLYPNHRFHVYEGNELPVSSNSVDYILIIAVLHHIPTEQLPDYLKEFRRILKSDGKVVVIEPCLFENSRFNNRFMQFFDKGDHIRGEDGYLNLFHDSSYETNVLQRFKKMYFYNELYFTAAPKEL